MNDSPVRAGAAVIAAGFRAGQLPEGLGRPLDLVATREQLCYLEASDPTEYGVGSFPVTIEHRGSRPPMISAFPELSPGEGVKLMLDRNGSTINPDDLTEQIDRDAQASLLEYARHRFPGLGRMLTTETCRYTMTRDEDFMLDLMPGCPNIAVASACSGHGFKSARVLGEIMLDLVTSGQTSRSIDRFRIARPGSGPGESPVQPRAETLGGGRTSRTDPASDSPGGLGGPGPTRPSIPRRATEVD